uniref:Uncharacterized protein n=1 Tax=Pseudomonas aeruginosa TaxID=287 RepID=A0A7S5YCF2_PSEAI|nr:hypothetical protein [Pseudomonas aeruginosa]
MPLRLKSQVICWVLLRGSLPSHPATIRSTGYQGRTCLAEQLHVTV